LQPANVRRGRRAGRVMKLPQRVPIGLHGNWYPAEP
jgi:carotenoid cleavage dioxygenase-like enzyme